MSQATRPSFAFLDRLIGGDKPGTLERQAQRALRNQVEELQERATVDERIIARADHLLKPLGSKALEAQAVIRAERKCIGTIRQALKEYDRYVRPDGRRNNGKGPKRVDPKAVAKGLKLMNSGMSIRRAAKVTGVSFGTLWKARNK